MFKGLKQRWQIAQCAIRVKNAINKDNIFISKANEYDNLLEFFEQFELLRYFWTKALDLKDPNQQIALFSIVYYLLDFQDDEFDFYFGDDKEKLTQKEQDLWLNVTDFIENPKEDYKNYILDYLSQKLKITDAQELFEKHLTHLYKIHFANFITSGYFDQFIDRYLLFFFFTEEFNEIDLEKDIIMIDENRGKINIEELKNQFDRIEVRYLDKYDFFQFKQIEIHRFVEVTMLKSLNSGMLMLRNKFGHL